MDALTLAIAAIAGSFIGSLVTFTIMAAMTGRAIVRTERRAWHNADLFYNRKNKEDA